MMFDPVGVGTILFRVDPAILAGLQCSTPLGSVCTQTVVSGKFCNSTNPRNTRSSALPNIQQPTRNSQYPSVQGHRMARKRSPFVTLAPLPCSVGYSLLTVGYSSPDSEHNHPNDLTLHRVSHRGQSARQRRNDSSLQCLTPVGSFPARHTQDSMRHHVGALPARQRRATLKPRVTTLLSSTSPLSVRVSR